MKNSRCPNDKIETENERLDRMDEVIHEHYGALHPDEVDRQSLFYECTLTTMIEVVQPLPMNSWVDDFHEGFSFRNVVFPADLVPLMRKEDVFLATMGHRENQWHVLWLSPPYERLEPGIH